MINELYFTIINYETDKQFATKNVQMHIFSETIYKCFGYRSKVLYREYFISNRVRPDCSLCSNISECAPHIILFVLSKRVYYSSTITILHYNCLAIDSQYVLYAQ